MTSFKGQQKNEVQKKGEGLALNWLRGEGLECRYVGDDPKYFKSGEDIIATLPQGKWGIDVKTDQKAMTNEYVNNAVVELIEIAPRDEQKQELIKPGWYYHWKVGEIYYIIWATKDMYICPFEALRDLVFDNDWPGFSCFHSKNEDPEEPYDYYSLGVKIPLAVMDKHFKKVSLLETINNLKRFKNG